MEVQKHESQGRPNLFDLDRWLSEHVRARQHLVYEEPAKCLSRNRRKFPKQYSPMNSSTLYIKSDSQPKGEEPTYKEPKSPACLCCNQAHPLYRCNEFKRKSVPERYELAKSFKVCFNCLKQGHQVDKCSNKTHCQVTNCKRHHHNLLNVQHLSHRLLKTHKLSPRCPLATSCRMWQPPIPSQLAREWFTSKLSRSKYKVKTGWP